MDRQEMLVLYSALAMHALIVQKSLKSQTEIVEAATDMARAMLEAIHVGD